jgi:hypothetical protein
VLVAVQCSARLGHSFHEGVNGRGSAPLQVVLILLDQIPETSRIRCIDAIDPEVVPLFDRVHLIAVGTGSELISEAQTHVGHIDTQHPEQTFFLTLSNLPQRPQKTFHMIIIFWKSAAVHAASEGSA